MPTTGSLRRYYGAGRCLLVPPGRRQVRVHEDARDDSVPGRAVSVRAGPRGGRGERAR